MREKAVTNDVLSQNKQYVQSLLIKNPKLKRKYSEVNKYCKFIKTDLDAMLAKYSGNDFESFLERVFVETLIIYFKKMLEFENVDDSEELYNTLYYLSFEYIKLVKKNENRKILIDKALPDLKVISMFFGNQVLNKDSFKKFDFKHISPEKIAGFLLENQIRTYQSKSKNISKEESEANIVYSLITLYMTSELERVFLSENLKEYEELKEETVGIDRTLQSLNLKIASSEKEMIEQEIQIETLNTKLDKINSKSELIRKIFYSKKLKEIENQLDELEKQSDILQNQIKNSKTQSRTLKAKKTKLENEFKVKIDNQLKELNNYYETDLIVTFEDFENKNKLKKKNSRISNDIIERLKFIGIEVERQRFELEDYVSLKQMVNDYKKRFSNRNIYHNKIVELLDKYGYYLKK